MSEDKKEKPHRPFAEPGGAVRTGSAARGTSVPAAGGTRDVAASSAGDVAAFVAALKSLPQVAATGTRGRLVFAMDATMSRQPTWDMALKLQGDMFSAVAEIGGLDVQLVYFRGLGECRASRWVGDPHALARLMSSVTCRGGHTQIGKVLSHVRGECAKGKVGALVYVGDAMEEGIDDLCAKAGELGVLGVPAFLFQEGREPRAEQAFREIARLTRGAWCPFDAGSATQLRDLLAAVAVYASGGAKALTALADGRGGASAGARRLLAQLPPPGR
ncbi:MAG: VWA domain-containing protein [Hyphomicrobiaceae bacterium]